MKVHNHGNNLIQLTYYGFVNVYLVREEDGFTLVDTALESCARSIVQTAQQFGQPIRRILLTHAHTDHSGGLDAVHALIPEAEFVMPARDARFLTGNMSLDADEPRNRLRGGWVIRKTRPTRLVQEGDRVGSLEVIVTPGHTPGHCSFLDTRTGTLIAGDAFRRGRGCCLRHLQAAFSPGVLCYLAQRAGPGERPQVTRPGTRTHGSRPRSSSHRTACCDGPRYRRGSSYPGAPDKEAGVRQQD